MPRINDLAGSALKLFCRDGTVQQVTDVASTFRRLDVAVGGKAPAWAPGVKVQFVLQGFTTRTFTPFAWSATSVSFLVYLAGHGPAAPWAGALSEGSAVTMFGPRSSLKLDLPAGPIMSGDETSFALAAAWGQAGTAPAVAHVFEVTGEEPARHALDHLGIDGATLIERLDDDAHHGDLAGAVVGAVREHPGAPLVLTGRAQTIRVVRQALKDAGLSPAVRVKAYWDSNRAGLD